MFDAPVASTSGYLYGFAFFRQKKDETIKRGYKQSALVLISDHPFFGLFAQVMSQVAPTYFSSGMPILEACIGAINSWPADPYASRTHALPLLGSTITFRTPEPPPSVSSSRLSALLPPSAAACPLTPRQALTACLQGINICSVFQSQPSVLWTLWELVLLAEPLIVLGSTPSLVSHAVLALVSLIWPLSYAGDFRPFFNIHNEAFRTLQACKPPAFPSVILGVTNPFILKTLKAWPHVVNLPEPPGTSVVAKGVAYGNTGKPVSTSPMRDGASPLLASTYVPALPVDKDVVHHLSHPRSEAIGAAAVNNDLLRAHFMQRTLVFLAPLEEYALQAFNNAWRKSTPFQCAKIEPFVKKDFLEWYSIREANKPGADGRQVLMERFLRCGTFADWHTHRLHEDEARLRELQAQAIRGLSTSMKSRSEIDKIDTLIACQHALKRPNLLPVSAAVLQEQMALIMEQLPDNLRKVMEKPVD